MAFTRISASKFPLAQVTENQLQQLGETLWSWPLCDDCHNLGQCQLEGCPGQRLIRLACFFEYYKSLTASYAPEERPGELIALSTHEDLFSIIRCLKSDPGMSRAQLAEKLYPSLSGQKTPSLAEQNNAIILAVRVMIMVNCSAQSQSTSLLESGSYQTPWRSDIPFSQFVHDIFPKTDHPSLHDDKKSSPHDMRTFLMARKLKKLAGMGFRPTDDIRNHLKLDRKNNILEIYHHTAFLKEQLRLTKDKKDCISISDSLTL